MATAKAEIIDDIQRVAEQLGNAPTTGEYREHGDYSIPTVTKYFDGFVAAREAAGVAEGAMQANTREDYLSDIRAVAAEVGGEPSKGDYEEHGSFALSTITYNFDSWVAAKKVAGVYEGANDGPTKDELLADMQRVDREESGALSQTVYNDNGKWTTRTVQRRFGSWEQGCQEAGVSRPKKGPQDVDDSAVLDDIFTVAEQLEKVPSKAEYNEHSERFSQEIARRRFGSWTNAVREAGFEPYAQGGNPGERNGNWKGGYEPYYGPNWNAQRRAARARDDYECVACGMTDAEHKDHYGWELEVHHIIPARTFDDFEAMNALDNLVTLCRCHHRKYEGLPNERAKKLLEG